MLCPYVHRRKKGRPSTRRAEPSFGSLWRHRDFDALRARAERPFVPANHAVASVLRLVECPRRLRLQGPDRLVRLGSVLLQGRLGECEENEGAPPGSFEQPKHPGGHWKQWRGEEDPIYARVAHIAGVPIRACPLAQVASPETPL